MNSRQLIKTLLITGAVITLPAIGNAAPQSAAMTGCVNAFMEALSKHNTPMKLSETHLIADGITPAFATTTASSELILTATDAHDSHTVARAICKLDAHGQVTGLEEVPAGSLLPL